jgi:hypothetical protein
MGRPRGSINKRKSSPNLGTESAAKRLREDGERRAVSFAVGGRSPVGHGQAPQEWASPLIDAFQASSSGLPWQPTAPAVPTAIYRQPAAEPPRAFYNFPPAPPPLPPFHPLLPQSPGLSPSSATSFGSFHSGLPFGFDSPLESPFSIRDSPLPTSSFRSPPAPLPALESIRLAPLSPIGDPLFRPHDIAHCVRKIAGVRTFGDLATVLEHEHIGS